MISIVAIATRIDKPMVLKTRIDVRCYKTPLLSSHDDSHTYSQLFDFYDMRRRFVDGLFFKGNWHNTAVAQVVVI